jgi:hypothetical protein
MLSRGIIRKSNSSYASPVLLRTKSDGSWRFCVDYRHINSLTPHDSFPIPRVQDLLRRSANAKYISTMDAEKGYWQIQMDQRSKKYTAFCTDRGFFEYNCMPFGLKNAPATYQRMMNELLKGLNDFCLVYQDDVLVFSKTFKEHKMHIRAVLEKFREAGLTLISKKCQFGKQFVKFLGHVVSSSGTGMNPEKVSAIKSCPTPNTRRQLRSFLGMIGWYSNFVERYADLAKPLYELCKPSRKFKWTPDANKAFQKLKNAIVHDLVLAHPMFGKPFVLRTDASNYGVGAVLSQVDEAGEERVVSFAGKVLDKAQINYTTSEKECYAIVYALEKFREYLEGHEFVLQTDNKALIYLDSMRNSNQRLMRWSWKLQEWSPYIQYIKGRDNVLADYLSRNPCSDDIRVDGEPEYIFPPGYTSRGSQTRSSLGLKLTCNLDRDVLHKAQVDSGDDFLTKYSSTDFVRINNVLYKSVDSKFLPVIPDALVPTVIEMFHDSLAAGHGGIERTLAKVSRCAYFINMKSRVADYVKTCIICQRVKPDNRKPPGLMQSSPIGSPWEVLYMDLMGSYVKSYPGGYSSILVIIDDFTKWVEIVPLKDATAVRIGKVLEESIFGRYGMPKTFVSDNGTNFTSNIMAYLCGQWKVKQRFTSPYHPQSNLTERANRTIETMIRAYLADLPHNQWSRNLPFLALAINNSKQESTGFTPANLLFNRDLNLPFDLAFDNSDSRINTPKTQKDVIFYRKETHANILDFVYKNLEKAKLKQKLAYDQKHRNDKFAVGDKVLLRDTTLSSAADGIVAGLMPLYRPDIATVTKVTGDLTYEISVEDGSVKPSVHIQHLRRYFERSDDSSGVLVLDTSNGNDFAQPLLDISNSLVNDHIVSDAPHDSSAVLQNTIPAGLDEPLALPPVSGLDTVSV